MDNSLNPLNGLRVVVGAALTCLSLLLILSLATAADDPPTATIDDITPDPAYETETVSFSGHGDDDGTIEAYRWTSDVDGLLSGRASFDFTGLTVDSHTISLEVMDDQGQWSDPDTTSLTIQANDVPDVDSLDPGATEVYRGGTVTITADGSDLQDDEDDLTPQFAYLPPNTQSPTWTEAMDGAVFSMDMSANGNYIVVGAIDDKVSLYHRDSNSPFWEFDTDDFIYSVAISRDGQFLAAGEKGGKVYFFEQGSSTPLWNYTTGGDVRALALSARGEYLAAGSMDGKIYLFDRSSSTPEWDFSTGGPVMTVAISADGEYVVGGSTDNEVYLLETSSGSKEWQSATGEDINSVAISGTGTYIVAGSNDDAVYLFNKNSATPQWSDTTGGDVTSVSISADGWYLAAGSSDNSVYFYKRDSATPQWSRSTGGTVRGVRISSDGHYISAGSEDYSLYLFSRASSTPLFSYDSGATIYCTAVADQGAIVVDGNVNKRVHLFDRYQDLYLGTPSYSGGHWQVDFDPPISATMGDYEFRVRLTDTAGGVSEWLDSVDPIEVQNNPPTAFIDDFPESPVFTTQTVNFSGHGTDLEGEVVAFTWESDIDGGLANNHTFNVTGLSAGDHNITFKVQDEDGNWSADLIRELEVIENHPPNATSLNFSATLVYLGQTLYVYTNATDDYTSEENLTIELMYKPPGTDPVALPYDTGSNVTSIGLNGDAQIYGVGTEDGLVYMFLDGEMTPVWSYDTGSAINSVRLAKEDNKLIVGTSSGYVYFMSSESSSPDWSYYGGSNVNSTAISDDAMAALAGTSGGRIAYFETQSSTPQWTYTAGDSINEVALSPDGGIIAAGSADENLYAFFSLDSNPVMTFDAGANVISVDMSMDLIVSGTDDDMAYAHFPDSDEPIWQRDVGSPVNSITISSDSMYIMVGTEAGRVYLLNQSEWDGSYKLKWLRNFDNTINHVALSEDGSYCLAGAIDGSIYYFHKNSSTPLWTQNVSSPVNEVAIDSQGSYQAAGSDNDRAYFFDRWTTDFLGTASFVDDQWVGTFTPPVDAPPGNYSFRVRFTDEGNAVGTWYYADDKVEVQEGPPVAYIDSISPDPAYDIDEINFTGHGEDVEDAIVAYEWTSDLDGELSTQPEFDAYLSVGNHNITFRVKDEEGQWSFNVTQALLVKLYQPPEATSVDPAAAQMERGSSRIIYANGTDDEVAEADLTIQLAYKDLDSGAGDWNTTYLGSSLYAGDRWQALFSPTAGAPLGNYSLRVRFSDGIQWSTWFYNNASLLVLNSRPTATIQDISPDPGYDVHPVDFTGQANDYEGPIAAYQWLSDLDGELSTAESFQVTGLTVGNHNLTFRAQDEEGLWSLNATYQLKVQLYQPPNATSLDPYPASLPREDDATIYANATDDVEAEADLTAQVEYRDPEAGSDVWNATYLSDLTYDTDRWEMTFTPPEEAPLGAYSLRVRFSDGLGWSEWLYQNNSLLVENAIPRAYIDEVEPNPVEPGEQANFTGHGSDSDGTVVEYNWTSDIDGPLSTEASFNTTTLTEDNHTISFSVRDNDGDWSEPVTLELVVEEYIEPPVAFIDSIAPNPVGLNEQVTFEGHGTTDEGTITNYQWRSDREGLLSTQVTFSTSSLPNGTHSISFRVRNSYDLWSEYVYLDLEIDIRPTANIQSIDPSPANESEMVTFTGTADDADGTVQEYRWSSNISGPFGSTATVNYDGLTVGNHTISFEARDDLGLWSTADTLELWIKEFTTSIRPVAYIDNLGPNPVVQGRVVNFYGSSYDDDGDDIVAHEWSSDIDGPLSTDEDFSTDSLSVGEHNISFRVQDENEDWSFPEFHQLTVLANQAPVANITSVSPNPAHPGEVISFEATTSDDDGTIVVYEWTIGGENLSAVEDFTNDSLPLGVHTISLRVQDDLGLWSTPDTMSLEVVENQLPVAVIENVTPNPAFRHQRVYLNGSATDADGSVVAYEWSSDIMGVLGNQARIEVTNLSPYPHQLSFRVRDDDGAWSLVKTRAISITFPNAKPQATISTILRKGTEGEVLTFQGTGFDSDGDVIAFQWESDLDGPFSSSPTVNYDGLSVGNHTISFSVQDDDGEWSDPDTMELSITAAEEPDPQDQDTEGEGFLGLSTSLLMLILLAVCLLLGGGGFAMAMRKKKDDGSSKDDVDADSGAMLPKASPGMDETDRILAAVGETGDIPPPKEDLPLEAPERIGDTTPDGPSIDFSSSGPSQPEPEPELPEPEPPTEAPDSPDLAELMLKGGEPSPSKLPDLPVAPPPPSEEPAPKARGRPSGPFGEDDDDVTAPFSAVGARPKKADKAPARKKRTREERPPAAPEPPTEAPAPPPPDIATIECPSCQNRMEIPKLGRLQTIKCSGCGMEGDVEI